MKILVQVLLITAVLVGCTAQTQIIPFPSITNIPKTPSPIPELTRTVALPATEASKQEQVQTISPLLTASTTPILAANQGVQTVDNLLEWELLPGPANGISRFAFDGTWLVTLTDENIGQQNPLLILLARKMDGTDREIFSFPEGKTIPRYEIGSGMEAVGGRLAFLVGPSGGDTTFGYELWLIDLESGESKRMKTGDRAFPAIALSEHWLVVQDSSSEYSQAGERCIETFSLPDGDHQTLFCTNDMIRWLELSGDRLTFIRYEAGNDPQQSCPTIETINLTNGEKTGRKPTSCRLGLQISASESLTVWTEVVTEIALRLRGMDSQGGAVDLERSRWGFIRVCENRVYYLGENQGAIELRTWQPNGTVEVLHRFRSASLISQGIYSQDKTLPELYLQDFQCGEGSILFSNSQDFYWSPVDFP